MIITYAISAYLVNHRTQRAIYIHLPCIHRKVASSLRNQCSKTVWGPWIPSFSRQVPPRRACSDIAWAVARCIWSPAQMRPQWRVVEAARRWKFPRGGRWLCDGQGQMNGEKKEDIGELCIMLLTQMMFATEKEECDDDPAWNKWCFFLRYLRLVMDTDRRIGNDMVCFYYVWRSMTLAMSNVVSTSLETLVPSTTDRKGMNREFYRLEPTWSV